MDAALEKLYHQFYSIPRQTARAKRIEENYQILTQGLSQEDLNRVMHLMDDKDLHLTEVSFDSFIRGFQLGSSLVHQVISYEKYPLDDGDSEIGSGK